MESEEEEDDKSGSEDAGSEEAGSEETVEGVEGASSDETGSEEVRRRSKAPGKRWRARRSTGTKEARKNAARGRTPAGVASASQSARPSCKNPPTKKQNMPCSNPMPIHHSMSLKTYVKLHQIEQKRQTVITLRSGVHFDI